MTEARRVTFETTAYICGRPARFGGPMRSGVLRCSGCGKRVEVTDTWERIQRAARLHVCGADARTAPVAG